MSGKVPGLPDEPFWTRGRVVAISLATTYVVVAFSFAGVGTAGEVALTCVFPLMCIWYPDAIAHYSGLGLVSNSIPVTKPTSEAVARFVGWGLLVLPTIWLALLVAELRGAK
jgi:hypothetical protein